jgi:hypothetical protein
VIAVVPQFWFQYHDINSTNEPGRAFNGAEYPMLVNVVFVACVTDIAWSG